MAAIGRSRFGEKPKSAAAWKAVRLGFAAFFLPLLFIGFFILARLSFDRESMIGRTGWRLLGAGLNGGVVLLSVVLSFSAVITAFKAFRTGERSWLLWLGFIPALVVGLFWVTMITGEILFPH